MSSKSSHSKQSHTKHSHETHERDLQHAHTQGRGAGEMTRRLPASTSVSQLVSKLVSKLLSLLASACSCGEYVSKLR